MLAINSSIMREVPIEFRFPHLTYLCSMERPLAIIPSSFDRLQKLCTMRERSPTIFLNHPPRTHVDCFTGLGSLWNCVDDSTRMQQQQKAVLSIRHLSIRSSTILACSSMQAAHVPLEKLAYRTRGILPLSRFIILQHAPEAVDFTSRFAHLLVSASRRQMECRERIIGCKPHAM